MITYPPTTRHCTTQSTHDEALIFPHLYRRHQLKVKNRSTGHLRHSGYSVDSLSSEARHEASYSNTQRYSLKLLESHVVSRDEAQCQTIGSSSLEDRIIPSKM